jgi:hypothetical protein
MHQEFILCLLNRYGKINYSTGAVWGSIQCFKKVAMLKKNKKILPKHFSFLLHWIVYKFILILILEAYLLLITQFSYLYHCDDSCNSVMLDYINVLL